jgi:hypothetical protein
VILRKCACGTLAVNEEELELFEIDSKSKYGRKNRCKECAALRSRGGKPLAPPAKTCIECKTKFVGLLEIEENFERFEPRGGAVVGNQSRVCKHCREDKYIYIGGVAIPRDLKAKVQKGKL